MKEQFLNLSGLTELVTYIKLCIAQHKMIIPRASFSLFPKTGDENNIYIDTSTNSIYRWNDSDKSFVLLARPPRNISISEGKNNGQITLKVDEIESNATVHGLKSAAFSNASSFATSAQGAKADSAVQSITIAPGTNNGTVKITVNGVTTDNIKVAGLGSAAFSDIAVFAPAKHTHSKSDVGLGNVDNTADIDKSVKYAGSSGSSNTIVYTALTNTNLNTLQTEGKWYYAGGGNTCTNVPVESAAFELYVGRNASGWRYQQFTVTSGEIYIRVFDSSNWGNWRKLAFTSDTVTAASSVPWSGITGKPTTFTPASHTHNYVVGSYTGNGGQQKPNYFGTNKVGFLMMNTTVNGDSNYKDWIIMDCYGGNDVGGSVALGVNRQKLAAYIMRSAAERSSWVESAELLHTQNYTSYTVTKTGSGASGTWGISISGNATTSTKLATARSINGTNFDGSGNITTATWGTARTLTIGNTGKSVNGGGNVSWSLSEIGAAASNHTHSYLPLSGGTMTGNISYRGSKATYKMIEFIDNSSDAYGNGIAIGGGGLTIIGGGESADVVKSTSTTGGDERLILANDGAIDIYTNCQNGIDKATHITIDNTGLYSGTAAKANSVPWSGVTGKPSSYTPSSHTHTVSQISDFGTHVYDATISRTANTVLAAPNGSSGPASFRKLVAADIPSITKGKITDFPTSLPASDVYAWAKASSKPSYSWSEIGSKPSTFTPSSHNHSYLTLYGSRPANINFSTSTNGAGAMFHFVATSSTKTGKPPEDSNVLQMNWDNNGGWDTQFAISNGSSPHSYIRSQNNGTWGNWTTLLDSSNYNNYSPSKTGTGASGTWGINITGSAGSCTGNAATASNASKVNGHTVNSDVPSGAKFTDTNTWRPLGTTADTACAGNDNRLSNARPASDVYSWAKASSKPSYSWSEITSKPSTFTPASHTHAYIPLSGGTITGSIIRSSGGSWISARNNVAVRGTATTKDSWNPVVGQATPNGYWTIGNLASNDNLAFSYTSNTNYNAGNNSAATVYLPVQEGTIITSATIGSQSVKYATSAGSAGSVAWGNVSGKPSSYTPSSHTHDDRYYTETEINTKLGAKLGAVSANGYYGMARPDGVECQDKIYAGTDVETSYGTEHFSATGDDQANIKTLSDVAMATKVSLPYHADGSQCKVYTYQDIIKIYCEIQKLILAETSYCNALNTYVRGLNTKEQIAAVKYGQEITDQAIKTNMDTVIAQGNAVMEGIVKQYLETAVPETKTDVKDTENTTDGTDNIEDAATEKSSKKA